MKYYYNLTDHEFTKLVDKKKRIHKTEKSVIL